MDNMESLWLDYQYSIQWIEFCKQRCSELTAQGIDPTNYDFKAEWISVNSYRFEQVQSEEGSLSLLEICQQISKFAPEFDSSTKPAIDFLFTAAILEELKVHSEDENNINNKVLLNLQKARNEFEMIWYAIKLEDNVKEFISFAFQNISKFISHAISENPHTKRALDLNGETNIINPFENLIQGPFARLEPAIKIISRLVIQRQKFFSSTELEVLVNRLMRTLTELNKTDNLQHNLVTDLRNFDGYHVHNKADVFAVLLKSQPVNIESLIETVGVEEQIVNMQVA
jgi:hypothetical protein